MRTNLRIGEILLERGYVTAEQMDEALAYQREHRDKRVGQILMELGFVKGETVTVIKNAPLMDPVEYQVLQAHISLRRSEADKIEVVALDDERYHSSDFNGTIADDIIASGESMLEVARELKKRGAKNIIANATFPLFTSGLKKFDAAVEEGILTAVLGTNLTYRKPELLERSWYFDVDCSKYCAYFVAAINHEMSVGSIIDPIKKIENLLSSR